MSELRCVENFIPKIVVFGVGGAGLNAINNMILSKLANVMFVVANTDCQSLNYSLAENKIQLGTNCTKGLGAGAMPEVGKKAAEEAIMDIKKYLENADMVFVAAGMGGGTGTGAAPIIAKTAKDMGILTIGVVTKPFAFEGARRSQIAETGIQSFEDLVDTLIVASNQNLLRLATEETSFAESFKMADDVLYNAVKCVVELLTKPGFINRDFADLRTVISSMGRAMIGYGECSRSPNRHITAAENAINNPILENGSIEGATSILINVTGGKDMKLFEVEAIVEHIKSFLQEDANVLFGTSFDDSLEGTIKVSIVATGMHSKSNSEIAKNAPKESEKKNEPSVELDIKTTKVTIDKPIANPSFQQEDQFSEEEIAIEKQMTEFEIFQPSHAEAVKFNIATASNALWKEKDQAINIDLIDFKKKNHLTSTEHKNEKKSADSKNIQTTLPFNGTTVYDDIREKIVSISKNIVTDTISFTKRNKPVITNNTNDFENNIENIWSVPAIVRRSA